MPNQPKLHHFLPEAYLRRFADERGDLWVIDRKQGIVRQQSPEVTAAERELYTLEDDCGERDRSVESAFGRSRRRSGATGDPGAGKSFVTCDAPVLITRPNRRNGTTFQLLGAVREC